MAWLGRTERGGEREHHPQPAPSIMAHGTVLQTYMLHEGLGRLEHLSLREGRAIWSGCSLTLSMEMSWNFCPWGCARMEVGRSEVRTPSYLQQVALDLAGLGVEATWELWVQEGRLQLLEMRESLIP